MASQSSLSRLTRQELNRTFSSRWLAAYTIVFLAGGTVFAFLGFSSALVGGYRGFVRAAAGVAHLSLLVLPIMAMLPAISTLADDRESGMLEYLLAQPLSIGEVYLSKWVAVVAGLCVAVTAGMGGAAGVGIMKGMPVSFAAILFGFVIAIALTFAGVGMLLLVVTTTRQHANAAAVLTWLILVAFGTLGLLTAFVQWGLPPASLVTWSFVNPVEAFRIGLLTALDSDLSLLGPVGAEIIARLGAGGTIALAAGSLTLWAFGPAVLGLFVARRSEGVGLL